MESDEPSRKSDIIPSIQLNQGDSIAARPPPPPLSRSPPCRMCGKTDVATVDLEESMLRWIWNVPACSVCLCCSHTERLPYVSDGASRATAIDGDAVLEVSTSTLAHTGSASQLQQLMSRVLRVHPGQVNVATPPEDRGAASAARSRVGCISLCTRHAGICASVVSATKWKNKLLHLTEGQFKRD